MRALLVLCSIAVVSSCGPQRGSWSTWDYVTPRGVRVITFEDEPSFAQSTEYEADLVSTWSHYGLERECLVSELRRLTVRYVGRESFLSEGGLLVNGLYFGDRAELRLMPLEPQRKMLLRHEASHHLLQGCLTVELGRGTDHHEIMQRVGIH